jgi:tRNA nucleotidyltransferase (CCA-adding enzyme)
MPFCKKSDFGSLPVNGQDSLRWQAVATWCYNLEMDLILTHEQADFDAMASMLAVAHLKDTLIPVLPFRFNRNVRKFINLYGAELPFVDVRDLPQEKVDSVTLVDTQSLVTLKGITRRTSITVIDHHQLRSDIPPEWHCTIEKTGATTTILVDALRDQNGSLSMIEATMLLLGIYEDTGSLTYASTTPRDVRAVAYLMEHGANLKVAAEFLNPSLSEEQLRLSDRLLANTQNLTIHGKNILVATADAAEMNEEISSVAHKLRDLLDPDALFIFVRTNEGIRLVARSTSDQINVAKIASEFGGGGHDRAAAALINLPVVKAGESDLLEENRAKLISLLPSVIKPSLTVGKIMSRRPNLLASDTTVEEAAHLMQRYGYEGFPVVEEGKVVGLLTRRAVDRALSHRLKSNAGSLMEAGDYSLLPSSTLDELQSLMATTGWGQIPVIDPQTHQVIGIVTRTDLLKMLPSSGTAIPGQTNYAARLDKALPPLRLGLLKLVANQAYEQKTAIYIVGGFVRDLVLERPSTDFDIVVEGDAIHLAKMLSIKFGGRVTSHKRFGTAKWQISTIKAHLVALLANEKGNGDDLPNSLDLVSARTEFYDHPSALPTVERSSIKLDLHRRDFTINTLALRLDGRHYGELYDYWGGLADIQKKSVKVLHSLSFVDDPTRMLRAVRFEQRFQFKIEDRTRQLMTEARPLLKQVSGERLRHEIDLLFNEPLAAKMLERMQKLDLLCNIHPGLVWESTQNTALTTALNEPLGTRWELPDFEGSIPIRHALGYAVWLIPLAKEPATEIALRLRLPAAMQKDLGRACGLWGNRKSLINKKPSEVVQNLEGTPAYILYSFFLLTNNQKLREILVEYVTHWRKVEPGISGSDLVSMGIPSGPVYREAIQALRDAWLDGQIHSGEEEKAMLIKILKQKRIQYGGTEL